MRHLQQWSLPLPSDVAPDVAFQRLAEAFAADPYTRVTHCDHAARTLHVEGQWWYHGELAVHSGPGPGDGVDVRAAKAPCATLTVFSKATGAQRLASWMPERQGVRFARKHFQAAVDALGHA